MRKTPSVLLQRSRVSLALPLALPAWPKAAVVAPRQPARARTVTIESRRNTPAPMQPRSVVDALVAMSCLPGSAPWNRKRSSTIGHAMLPEKTRQIHRFDPPRIGWWSGAGTKPLGSWGRAARRRIPPGAGATGRLAERAVLVGLRRERIGVELVVGQAAAGDEVTLGRLDHDRRAAGVDLVLEQVREVVHHGLVDEAGAAMPIVLGLGLGQDRDVAQVRQLGGRFLGPRVQVEVGLAAAAPVEDGLPFAALPDHVLDDRLDRRESGSRGEQDDRLLAVLAQEEAAERPFDAQDLLLLHRAEDVVGELAAGQVADVQLELRLVDDGMRRVGHRVAAPGTVAQDELDVLAGAVLEQVVGGQLQANDRDVGRGPVDRDDAAGQLPDRELARARHGSRLEDDVG